MGWRSGVDPGGVGDGGVSVARARCGAAEWGWFGRVGRAAKPGAGLRKYIRIETGCEASSGAERRCQSCGCADCASLGGGCCGSAGAVVAGSRYWKHAPACGDCEFCAAVSSDWNPGAAKCEAGGDAAIRDVVQPAGRARFELARCANAPAKRAAMSLLDLIFYYFFPPSSACIEQVLTQDPKATFAPIPATGSNDSTDPVLQVSLACKPPATMAGFFASQVSSGITFAQTNDGPRAFARIGNFYLAPMDRETIGGMTWFIFEAQRTDPVGPNASTNFSLPGNMQGAQSDYFWAIGAISPFPFVSDAPRANQPLIHVAYAGVGANGNKKAEFMTILQRVQVKGAAAGQ